MDDDYKSIILHIIRFDTAICCSYIMTSKTKFCLTNKQHNTFNNIMLYTMSSYVT